MSTMTKFTSLVFICVLIAFTKCSFLKSNTFIELKQLVENKALSAMCFVNNNGTVFDLNPLYNENIDYQFTNLDQSYLKFNMCKNALTTCEGKASGLVKYITANQTDCVNLAGNANEMSRWSIVEDKTLNSTTIKIDLPLGEICRANVNEKYSITMKIKCDEGIQDLVYDTNTTVFNINQCSNTINMRSRYACPKFNYYTLWNSFLENKYSFGSFLIVLGLFLAFLGRRFVKVTEFIMGVVVVLVLVLYIIFNYISIQYNSWIFWTLVGVSIVLGILLGWFFSKQEWLAPAVIGGLVGYITGVILYNLAFKYITWNPIVIYWLVLALCIAGGVLLGLFVKKHTLIIGCGVIGSYLIIRGASLMIGYFPDERQLFDLLQKQEWEQVKNLMTYHVYIYILFFFIFAIAGIIIQYKFFNSDENKKDQKPNSSEPIDEKQKLLK